MDENPDRPAATLLDRLASGDAHAADELLPLVYDELRRLARSRLAREAPGQTLTPTALVHEAHLRLAGPGESAWPTAPTSSPQPSRRCVGS